MKTNDPRQQFISALRSALHYLYDPDHLHRSPLVSIFGLEDRVDASTLLQKILLEAIEKLKPTDVGEEDPLFPRAWMIYDLLYYRYVRGYERQAVAKQLSISERQLSRENSAAIERLALALWESSGLDADSLEAGGAMEDESLADEGGAPPGDPFERLPAEKLAPWPGVLAAALEIIRPLAEKHAVLLPARVEAASSSAAVPQTSLRHALLSLLSALLPGNPGSVLRIEPLAQPGRLRLNLEISPARFDAPIIAAIATARSLLEHAGGQLDVLLQDERAVFGLALPTVEQTSILVVDDNPDAIHLFTRYAQGTQYTVIGAQDGLQALELAPRLAPRIVLLDVMMPEMDGWELLGRLRHLLAGQPTQFVVCSILPQAAIAYSLGADGFLQKPVRSQDFLALLEQLDR